MSAQLEGADDAGPGVALRGVNHGLVVLPAPIAFPLQEAGLSRLLLACRGPGGLTVASAGVDMESGCGNRGGGDLRQDFV